MCKLESYLHTYVDVETYQLPVKLIDDRMFCFNEKKKNQQWNYKSINLEISFQDNNI